MGIAILWVLLYHTSWTLFEPLHFIVHKGYGGVDIFLFLSGFGIYFSLERKGGIFSFYLRRLFKIIPAYWTVLFLLFVKDYGGLIYEGYTKASLIRAFFMNAFFLAFLHWQPVTFNWYIFALVYFYLLSPVFHALIKKGGGLLLLLFSLFLPVFFFGKTVYLYAAWRLFLYLLGMITAHLSLADPDRKINTGILYGAMFIGVIALYLTQTYTTGLLDPYGLWFPPFILVTPGLILLLCLLLEKREKWPVLSLLGRSSLEIYLINVAFKDALYQRLAFYIGWNDSIFPIAIPLMILAGILLHFLIEAIRKPVEKMIIQKRG